MKMPWLGALTAVGTGVALWRLHDAVDPDAPDESERDNSTQDAGAQREPAERGKRLNRSSQTNIVFPSPPVLLAQAKKIVADITYDELTAARLAASEHASGTFAELCAIVDAELNRAERKGKSLFRHLTYHGAFGRQDRFRPASTRRDPYERHLAAARAVIGGEQRGISQGAIRFFDPLAQHRGNARYVAWVEGGRKKEDKPRALNSCGPLDLLEAWSFDYAKRPGQNRCPPDKSKPGKHPLAWVGPIPGVDPLRLMLFRPEKLGSEHVRQYQAARSLLLDHFARA